MILVIFDKINNLFFKKIIICTICKYLVQKICVCSFWRSMLEKKVFIQNNVQFSNRAKIIYFLCRLIKNFQN